MPENEPTPKDMSEFVWDTEERSELISAKEGHIRDTMLYATAALWKEMTEAWGVITHVKTSTDEVTSKVTVAKARQKEPGAVAVRLIGAQNTAEFSFFRPLVKLGLKVPPSRQFNVEPVTELVRDKDGKTFKVFVFPMADRTSVPRNKREEAAAKGSDAGKAPEEKGAAADDSSLEEEE